MSVVSLQFRNRLAIVTVDYPPVNALSQAVRAGIVAALDDAERAGAAAVVLHCAGRTFVAGADIREFGRPPGSPWLPEVIARIEACRQPVVAALHGTALGGGLELALGCHNRVAVPSARVGLPEVNLGLIPGAGGTQRLPRLVGAARALDMMISGKPVDAAFASAGRASSIGLSRAATCSTGPSKYALELALRAKHLPGAFGILRWNPWMRNSSPGTVNAYRPQDARTHVAGADRALCRGVRCGTLRRCPRAGAVAFHGVHGIAAVEGAAPPVLRGARGGKVRNPASARPLPSTN